MVTGLTAALQAAGRHGHRQVALQSQFFDDGDSTEAKLNQLAQSAGRRPPG